MTNENKVTACKVCKNSEFTDLISLGEQSYTGIFTDSSVDVEKIPLELISCNQCGLLQIGHDYDLNVMYGEHYGYRSSQNNWMVEHLKQAVSVMSLGLMPDDLVIEVGSNDATALSFFPNNCRRVGVDPSARPLKSLYPANAELIIDFFSDTVARAILERHGKAKIIMSFAMFYDLPDPIEFAKNVALLLEEDGQWVFEQSYLLTMLESGSFDTICHEHLEYYRLADIEKILEKAKMKVIDVTLNESNGGSFRVTAVHSQNKSTNPSENVIALREKERLLFTDQLFDDFLKKVTICKDNVKNLLDFCKKEGLNLYGIGASTKGNVLLQYCNLGAQDVLAIGEINPDKIGKVCPGSKIPIIPEDEALSDKNGVYLILPWHFKEFFLNSEKFKNKKMIFPLPHWEIYND